MSTSLRLLAALASVIACVASSAHSIAAAAEIAGRRPNIVLLITDDQGYGDLSCHGNPILKTPNLDRLHAEGVRFTDFYVSPTCSPTRASLMTGRHEFKNGVTHTILERERLTLKARTLAQVLKEAGYTTGIFGKWHLGDEAEYQPNRRGFDEVFIHGAGGIGQSYEGSCGDAPGNRYFNPAILHNGTFEKTEGYCTDVFFRQASKWVGQKAETVAGERVPFFCYIATNAPHGPLDCPEEYIARYRGKTPTEDVAKFYGMIANIDDNVGRLLARLEELKIDRETLFIFMNDNGGTAGVRVFNAGMRGQKGTAYRGGTRGASFWRWPGTLTAADCDRLSAHIDLYPTLAEIAGAKLSSEIEAKLDGRSLTPLLANPKAEWADRLIFTHVGRWNKGTDANLAKYAACSVRDPRFQLVSARKQPAGPDPARAGGAKRPKAAAKPAAATEQSAVAVPKNWELFDLKADPGETRNIAAEHPEVVARLEAAYDKWWAEVVPETLENERAPLEGPNPFRVLYEKQFGPAAK
jgi:arylsulfatase